MNKSLWEDVSIKSFPTLDKDISTDVLIIGGGIAGILTAYFLQKEGIDYLLVEKGRICRGVTAKTTAKITYQHGFNYQKILSLCGEECARGYYLANKKALEKYKELCREIDCDFEKKSNFVYSFSPSLLEKEFKALNRIGCKAEYATDLPLPIKDISAIKVTNQAQFHPLKFLSQISRGLNIYEHTKVLEMVGNTAVCEKAKIKAKRVVVATHFPFINKHGKYFLKLYQHRSYVLALKNAGQLDGMFVDENDKGFSFRNYGDLLLLGGGGHRTGKQGGSYNELRKFARIHYPNAMEVAAWATQDCISLDKMAYIGKYSSSTAEMYVASGFNKWGMTGAMCSAMLLSDMLTAKENEFLQVFSPQRSILKPQLAVNGFEAVFNLVTPTTKRCPHLGCALKWNRQERSWDCPCHGSRFSDSGELLNGPATDGIVDNK
ncbi:MAG: FAD-dependent oxidoreductase [Clostridia bacterium]|nr:FAD-dependent oxidoreductase [Clostridia bacterium]MBR6741164.1 FAD-dependent oxidoreductase [Clostridia bacterium]